MRATIYKTITSYRTTIILLVIYAITMAFATIIEKFYGTMAAKILVYYSPLFFLIHFFLIVNFVATFQRFYVKKQKKYGFMLVHFSFIIILAGALISHISGIEGTLHLREGESSEIMVVQTSKGETFHKFPFSVELIKFTLSRYPGSSSPSSYESDVIIHMEDKSKQSKIFMNNVLDVKGYRFFQASYDKDEKGTILSINKDVAGRNVTYTGYLLLTIGLIFCLTGKNSRFRYLNRQLKQIKFSNKMATSILLLFFSFPVIANPEIPVTTQAIGKIQIDPAHAAKFGSLPMQSYNGRTLPVNTFSSEVLRKLHKSEKIYGLNSDQFLLSLLALPEMWMRVPLIRLPNKELAYFYDLSEGNCSYMEMFDSNGNYKLENKLKEVYAKMPAKRTSLDKDLIKLDEKVNILHQLLNRQMLNIFPRENDEDKKWYAPGDDLTVFTEQDSTIITSGFNLYLNEIQIAFRDGDWSKADEILNSFFSWQKKKNNMVGFNPGKIKTEVFYNQMKFFQRCKRYYLILGGILLVISFITLFKENRWYYQLIKILVLAVILVFIVHTTGIGLRWYISGYAPWSNSYETMVYVSWATILGGLFFFRSSKITFSLATLFGGVILFVSGLNWMDPQINPLVPVLKSPWLMFHVAVIVAAYGFFGISFLIGITNLVITSIKSKHLVVKELSIINEMSLIIGLILMITGTFLGAVWANESWGRYWGWDPKETWALITVIVYTIVLHLRLVKKWNNLWLFNITSVLAFSCVLMTYFGVNYFLSGMHSYGHNEFAGSIFIYIFIILSFIVGLGIISYRKINLRNTFIKIKK